MNGRCSRGSATTGWICAVAYGLSGAAFAAAATNDTCSPSPLFLAHEVQASVRSNVDRPVVEYVPDRDGPLSISVVRHGVDAAASVASAGAVIEAASPALQDSEETLAIQARRGMPVRLTLIPTEVGGAPATVLVRFERPRDAAVASNSVQWRVMSALTSGYSLYQTQVRREQQAAAATLSALDAPAKAEAEVGVIIEPADWETVGASFAKTYDALSGCLEASADERLQRLAAELALARASLASLKLESWEDAMRLSQDAERAARALALAERVTRAQLLQASALIDGAVESKRSNDPARQGDSALSFKKAAALLEAALAIYRKAGRLADQAYVENYLGAAAHYAGYWESAGRHYEAAEKLYARAPRSFRRAVLTQNRATLASDRGDYPEAARLFESAKALIRAAPEPDMLATILENHGGTLSVLGRQDEAIAEYAAAIGIRRAQADDAGLARSLLGTGAALMRAGDLRAAQPAIEQAWALRSKTQNRDRRGWLASGLMRAELHRRRGEYAAAKQTLDLIEGAAISPSQQARLAIQRGRLAMDQGDYAGALAQYDIVPTLSLPAFQPNAALARIGHSRALIGLGRLDEARAELAGAVEMPQMASTLAAIETTYLLAETEARRGNRIEAVKRVDQAIAATRRIRATSLSAESRARFTASRREQDELKICLLAGCSAFAIPRSPSQTASAMSSLLASEEARAGALAELLTSASDRREQGERADAVRGRLLAELESKLARLDALSDRPVANALELAALRQAVLEIEIRLRGLDANTPNEATREMESRRGSTDISAVLSQLPPDTTVLEFFLGRQSALVWVLARGTLQVHEIAAGAAAVSTLRRDVRALLELSATDASIEDRLGALGRLLIERHVDPTVTKHLFIVPDGELFFTPFAALRVTPSAGGKQQFLAETTAIVLLPALSQLELDAAAFRPLARDSVVTLVADPVYGRDDGRVPASVTHRPADDGEALDLARLPATIEEVRAVQALLPNAKITVLSGIGATREAVLRELKPGVAVAHLATHGVIRASNPGLSFLALSAYDRDWRPAPVRLYGTDILSSGLRADLVVLSACRSAIGDVVPGEGPMGLSYSFLANGSGSVIAPIWPVPDTFAAGFMGAFYRSLVTDELPPASALRAAQAWARGSALWSSPYYWAAFSLTSRHL